MNFNKRVNGSWVDTPNYIHNTSTDTITTLPAVLYPNAVTATVGLKGNMSQTGTPTPQNPIQPSETGDMSSNMFDITAFVQGIVPNRCTIDYDSDTNTLYINSTGGDAHTGNSNAYHIPVVGGETISMKWETNSYNGLVYIFENGLVDSSHLHSWNSSYKQCTLTLRSDTTYIIIRVGVDSKNVTKTYSNIMLNTGSTALDYQPYGYKIPILSNSTTTPVYLGEVETTRRIKKYEFTGQEDWTYSASGGKKRVFVLGFDRAQIATALCSHFDNTDYVSYPDSGKFAINTASATQSMIFGVTDMAITSATDWTTYLAQQYSNGTPVTVWYVLATETTGIVNEPIRKIGNYADTVSGITIPTIAGANSFDVLTTLKPSEVTVNYKGWHPVSAVHERDNGAWT